MRLPTKTLEQRLLRSGYRYVVGVDEVGMGCLAGPVFVSAVVVGKKFFSRRHKNLGWLRDSKLLSKSQREKFFKAIKNEKEIHYEIAFCKPKTIDKLNIYQAARLAMRRAILKIFNYQFSIINELSINQSTNSKNKEPKIKTIILVDGKTKIKGLDFDQMPIVKGDRKVFAIACASIIAKVMRDKTMMRYSKKFPGYGFDKHKGYGTEYHKAQLVSLGPCEIHRKSFTPVLKSLKI